MGYHHAAAKVVAEISILGSKRSEWRMWHMWHVSPERENSDWNVKMLVVTVKWSTSSDTGD